MSFLINPYAFLAAGGDYESIATVTVGSGGAAAIEFTSIGTDWQHLQVRILARRTDGAFTTGMQFNGVTTADYHNHVLRGDGSSASAGDSTGRTNLGVHDNQSNTTYPVAAVVDILDYASTSKTKTIRSFGGFDNNGSGQVSIWSGFYNSTNAITSIKLIITNGNNFSQHSTAALYGIKAP